MCFSQDGSCNGLQHYAALARDQDGGRAVNLMPGDAPADVYRRVWQQRRSERIVLILGLCRGIADLVSEAVKAEAASEDSKVRAGAVMLRACACAETELPCCRMHVTRRKCLATSTVSW